MTVRDIGLDAKNLKGELYINADFSLSCISFVTNKSIDITKKCKFLNDSCTRQSEFDKSLNHPFVNLSLKYDEVTIEVKEPPKEENYEDSLWGKDDIVAKPIQEDWKNQEE